MLLSLDILYAKETCVPFEDILYQMIRKSNKKILTRIKRYDIMQIIQTVSNDTHKIYKEELYD